MRMLKSLINNSTIVVRVKYVIYKYSKFSLMVLVLSCFIALYFLLNIDDLFKYCCNSLALIFSFALSYFALNKINFSKNVFIGFVQRWLILNIVFFITMFIVSSLGFLFGFSLGLLPVVECSSIEDSDSIAQNKSHNDNTVESNKKEGGANVYVVDRDLADKAIDAALELGKAALQSTGKYAAAGSVGAAIVKHMPGTPV